MIFLLSLFVNLPEYVRYLILILIILEEIWIQTDCYSNLNVICCLSWYLGGFQRV